MSRFAVSCFTLLSVLALSPPAPAQQTRNGVGLKVAGTRPPDVAPVAGQPLETRPPIGEGQTPAFRGQTRAPAVITQTHYSELVMTKGLTHPWGLVFLPDGKIIVNEKSGVMRLINRKSGRIEGSIANVPHVQFAGDGGLLDVVLDPDFATNRFLYFCYVEPRGPEFFDPKMKALQQDSGVSVARAKLSRDDRSLLAVKTLVRVVPSLTQVAHFGSRLLFGRDGFLYISLGERFFYPTAGEAQSLFSQMGKILRITRDGDPAPGNPFAEHQELEDHTLPEIWSIGHRNPEGLAMNLDTGEIWDSEHGPQGGDEINVIKRGANYGWPLISYGRNYDGTAIDGSLPVEDGLTLPHRGKGSASSGLTAMEGMEQPRYYWDPVIAPSGMTFYDGKLMPEWKGNLFVAGLAGQHVSRLVLNGQDVIGEERLLLDQHQRMRDVKEGPDGALWVITDDANGRLIRIVPDGVTGSGSGPRTGAAIP